MNVKITLVVLTMSKAELHLVLPGSSHALPSKGLENGDPDRQAQALAVELSGDERGVQRHGFLPNEESGCHALMLLYTQILSEDCLQRDALDGARLIPATASEVVLSASEAQIVSGVVDDLKSDLNQVMQSRLNTRGLIHLLGLLPDIFDHKELAAAYYALTGEKPSSPLMLARMMLDRYTMGSGDRQREVKGRDLIEEYEPEAADLLGEKWAKNKELYRSGGPKAKRLYKKNLSK